MDTRRQPETTASALARLGLRGCSACRDHFGISQAPEEIVHRKNSTAGASAVAYPNTPAPQTSRRRRPALACADSYGVILDAVSPLVFCRKVSGLVVKRRVPLCVRAHRSTSGGTFDGAHRRGSSRSRPHARSPSGPRGPTRRSTMPKERAPSSHGTQDRRRVNRLCRVVCAAGASRLGRAGAARQRDDRTLSILADCVMPRHGAVRELRSEVWPPPREAHLPWPATCADRERPGRLCRAPDQGAGRRRYAGPSP